MKRSFWIGCAVLALVPRWALCEERFPSEDAKRFPWVEADVSEWYGRPTVVLYRASAYLGTCRQIVDQLAHVDMTKAGAGVSTSAFLGISHKYGLIPEGSGHVGPGDYVYTFVYDREGLPVRVYGTKPGKEPELKNAIFYLDQQGTVADAFVTDNEIDWVDLGQFEVVNGKLALDQRPRIEVRMAPGGMISFVEYTEDGKAFRVKEPPEPFERDGVTHKWACQALRYRQEVDLLAADARVSESEKIERLVAYTTLVPRDDEEPAENGFGYDDLHAHALAAMANLGTPAAIAQLAALSKAGRFTKKIAELVPASMLAPAGSGATKTSETDEQFGEAFRVFKAGGANDAFRQAARTLFYYYPVVAVSTNFGSPVWTPETLNKRGAQFDAVRFTSPPGTNWDMYFAFSNATNQSPPDLYIIPLVGDMTGFTFSRDANKTYKGVPWPDAYEVRLHQMMGGNIGPGRDYLIWFTFPDKQPADMYFGIVLMPASKTGYSDEGLEEGLGLHE